LGTVQGYVKGLPRNLKAFKAGEKAWVEWWNTDHSTEIPDSPFKEAGASIEWTMGWISGWIKSKKPNY
jgi:hypothetical protein